jgi:hypothetical protein
MMKAVSLQHDPVVVLNANAQARGWTFTCHADTMFDAPKLNAMNALWQSLSPSGKLPHRAAFSARAMKDFLPNLLIADVVATETHNRFRYRYVGTNVVRYIGEMTGKFMDEILPPEVNERTAACYQTIFDARTPLRFVTRFSMDAISFLSAEFFGAPLANDGKTPDMIMSVTDFLTAKP